MHSYLNFWLILFWISILFFYLNTSNLIKLFITSEIIWVIIYAYCLIVGFSIDDTYMYTLSLLIITLASVEFSIGFILVILFKKIFKTVDILTNTGTDWSVVEKFTK